MHALLVLLLSHPFYLQSSSFFFCNSKIMELAVNYSYKRKNEEQDLIGKLELKDSVDEDEGGNIDCSLKLGLPCNNPPVPPDQPVLNTVQVHDQQSLPLPHNYAYYSTVLPLPPPPPSQVTMNSYAGVVNQRGNICYINGGMGNMDPRSSRVNIPFHLAGRMINLNGIRSNMTNINNLPSIGFGFYGTPMIMSSVGIIRPNNMYSTNDIINNNNIIERSFSSISSSPLPLLNPREIGNEAVNRNSNKCSKCHTTETPMWRKGPDGSKSLCNACGLRFRKELKKKMETEGKKKGFYMGESSTKSRTV